MMSGEKIRWRTSLILSIVVFNGFLLSLNGHVTQGQSNHDLQLTTIILKAEYCERDHLRFRLRYRYTNTGSETLILYRYTLAVTRELISRSLDDAQNHRYVSTLEPMVNPVLPKPASTAKPDDTLVILRPQEVYEIDGDYHIDLPIYDSSSHHLLPAGTYFLQLRLPTWWFGEQEEHRQRWMKYGYLWTKDVVSAPMLVRIESKQKRQVVKCALH
jgi:hypothetical protein